MKKFIGIISIGILLVIGGLLVKNTLSSFELFEHIPIASPTPTSQPYKTITYSGKTYAYAIYTQTPQQSVTLIPNFDKKISGSDIIKKEDCTAAINGSFYDTKNAPLGLFTIDTHIYREKNENPLINGFVWSSSKQNFGISDIVPSDTPTWIFQTGPILMSDGETRKLQLTQDAFARRSVIGLTTANNFVIIELMLAEVNESGPLLRDTPELVKIISVKENILLTDGINLDGGSASFYKDTSIEIPERQPVGSVICFH